MRLHATYGLTCCWPLRAGRSVASRPVQAGATSALVLAVLLAVSALGWRPASAATDVPPLPAAVTPYYVAGPEGVLGPVALAIVLDEIRGGAVHPWTLVWKPGLSGWIRAGSLPELAAALAEVAAPAPSPPPLPPLPPPDEAPGPDWFAAIDGAARGPWTGEELAAAIAAGEVGRTTLVWRPGTAGWAPAKTFPELAGLFTITPPDLPPTETPPELPPPVDVTGTLVGTWDFQPAAGVVGAETRIAFAADMTFTGEVSVAIPGGGDETRAIAGTWSVTEGPAPDGFILVLAIDGAAPFEVGFRIVDGDTLAGESAGITARRITD